LEDSVDDVIKIMAKTDQSEIVVLDEEKKFCGKVDSLSLIKKSGTLRSAGVVDGACLVIFHDASLQDAMEVAANFVGEIIPIIEQQTNQAMAVITEGAIFQAYLSKQNQTVEMEKR
jgi:CBS domain-containing protein